MSLVYLHGVTWAQFGYAAYARGETCGVAELPGGGIGGLHYLASGQNPGGSVLEILGLAPFSEGCGLFGTGSGAGGGDEGPERESSQLNVG
jgi:hypothetical protein